MAAFLGLQYFGMDLSAFPTPMPAFNVIIVTAEFLFLLYIFRQLFSALVIWTKQEHAFWGVPSEPVASILWGHAAFVSLHVCVRACARPYFLAYT